MPQWFDKTVLDGLKQISFDQFQNVSGIKVKNWDELKPDQQTLARAKYNSISLIVPLIGNPIKRNGAITLCSDSYGVSKATIRKRLCLYLIYNNISIFLGPEKQKTLSDEEKVFRWALNKFFYNSKQLSLRQAYKEMLKSKYCDSNGNLLQNFPKFHRFKYFYYKMNTCNLENTLISFLRTSIFS